MDQPKTERRCGPWIVLGSVVLDSGKLATAMMMGAEADIPADWATVPVVSDPRVKFFSKVKHTRAGTIITLDSKADGSEISPSSMRFVRDLPEPYATSWAIWSEATRDAHKLKRANQNAAAKDLPFDALEPWRKLISRTYGETRIALIARLLNYVERGTK